MIVEITGVNTRNKGAELMLAAIQDRFARHHPEVQLAVDQWFGSYADRARYGLLQKMSVRRPGRSKMAVGLMPASFRRTFGLVADRDVDAVLDASGFAFGDQHPSERTLGFARAVETWRQRGKPVILLPQALGPFERPPVRAGFVRIASAANLVFARDPVSLEHARKAVGAVGSLQLAPDFTPLVSQPGAHTSGDGETVYIVPNQRMVEKAGDVAAAAAYVPFVASCIACVEEAGLRPVFLLHGGDDAGLVRPINAQMGRDIAVVVEDDPLEIKRLLGQSVLVIGARFHALVSALSQGVPCIATSWSHKYEMLFEDYACADMVLSVASGKEAVQERVQRAVGPARPALVDRIRRRGERLVEQIHAMWGQVDRALGLADG
jgi:colanic acid/amylovoran biosynthesis protein